MSIWRGRSLPYRSLQLIIIALAFHRNSGYSCPRYCRCDKTAPARMTVACLNANFTVIPSEIHPDTDVLHLVGNSFEEILSNSFSSMGLNNLRSLSLADCQINYIHKNAFRGLESLLHLNLSRNMLNAVPTEALGWTPKLIELVLNDNFISKIRADSFKYLKMVEKLEIMRCKLGCVEKGAFKGLERSLTTLRLEDNHLNNLDVAVFVGLKSLRHLHLAGNAVNCSCTALPLRKWMLLQRIPIEANITCRYPLYNKGSPFVDLPEEFFACLPKVQIANKRRELWVGDNVTLPCKVIGQPTPSITWSVRNGLMSNGSSTPSNYEQRYAISNDVRYYNLTINHLELPDSGQYTCIAENRAGKSVEKVELIVKKRKTMADDIRLFSEEKVIFWIILSASLVVIICSLTVCIQIICRRPQLTSTEAVKKEIINPKTQELRMTMEHAANKISVSQAAKREKAELTISQIKGLVHNVTNVKVAQPEEPPRRNFDRRPSCSKNISPTEMMFESHIGEAALHHHVLHRKNLPSGSLYTTAKSFLQSDFCNDIPIPTITVKSPQTPKPADSIDFQQIVPDTPLQRTESSDSIGSAESFDQKFFNDTNAQISCTPSPNVGMLQDGSFPDPGASISIGKRFMTSKRLQNNPSIDERYTAELQYQYPSQNRPAPLPRARNTTRKVNPCLVYALANHRPTTTSRFPPKSFNARSFQNFFHSSPVQNSYNSYPMQNSFNYAPRRASSLQEYPSTYCTTPRTRYANRRHPQNTGSYSELMRETNYNRNPQIDSYLDDYQRIPHQTTAMSHRGDSGSGGSSVERTVSFSNHIRTHGGRVPSDDYVTPRSILKSRRYSRDEI